MTFDSRNPGDDTHDDETDIAVIGMAGRFPGARDLTQFWANVAGGVESISVLTDDQLASAGVPASIRQSPDYVPAASRLEDADCFDASFFGYSPREAAFMDPQSRVCLELAWHAVEDAGYCSLDYAGSIGVFATASLNTYLLQNLAGRLDEQDFVLGLGNIPIVLGNGPDFVATRVSYKLNLRGPSVAVQTACSSSLTAIHLARQSLLNGECDLALAGGVSIYLPQDRGYRWQDGMILSSDGHCRAFDADADGIVFGRGGGMVLLKPLARALEDGDRVRAVIKGSAANNDGSRKVGFTAPSVTGQSRVIAEALADAGLRADSISYIEAHGTGTTLGDPIEIAGLTEAFRKHTTRAGYCAIGTVKTNIGHLDVAAGVTAFIKTVLMLENRQLPPSLHFNNPNPAIDFATSPFYVNTSL
ncbi:MAG TPA: polyketide synthase, partial [Gemmatimonadaceae bacterium]|nr:polyketide synthase [Gemmatimonadaceae bacterium]